MLSHQLAKPWIFWLCSGVLTSSLVTFLLALFSSAHYSPFCSVVSQIHSLLREFAPLFSLPRNHCPELHERLYSGINRMPSFTFFFFFLEIWAAFYLFIFYLWWILSYIEMKQPWVYMCSPSRSPLPPPSPPAPSRFSQCTRSERFSHASNLGCWSVSP